MAVALVVTGTMWLRKVIFPRRPADADTPRPTPMRDGPAKPLPSGHGVRIVVNPSAGPSLRAAPEDELREALPEADIVVMGEGDDLLDLLAAPGAAAIGAAGGDGTLNAAATAALAQEALFVPVPAGTLNHLARDLGLCSVEDTIKAVRTGHAACIDVGTVGDRVFLNTFSFGGYGPVVDRREQWEHRIGKWPALLVALVWELPRMQPIRVEIDGEPMRVWLMWVGNCRYSPAGLAPAWRESLEDGLLDVRIVYGARRFSKTRFGLAALAGRLARSRVYSERRVEQLEVRCLDGAPRLATDGETFDGPEQFTIQKRRRALRVALPAPD